MQPLEPPGKGRVFVAIAAASFATGPTIITLLWLASALVDGNLANLAPLRWSGIPLTMVVASIICLIGSVPAACVNAFVLSRAARNDMDAPWFSILSGGLIGALVAMIMTSSRFEEEVMMLFAATGACMGLLHWVIAIRPRRRWRRFMERDEEAIRAME